MSLLVAEVFGPTFQGEGPTAGRRCGFVRLGRCNLDCGSGEGATWACDTPYTWDWARFDPTKELTRMPVGDVLDRLRAMAVDRVVVTGGEPMLQRGALTVLATELAESGINVEVETNGTQPTWPALTEAVVAFNVSPKLRNSGVEERKRLDHHALVSLRDTGKAWFKFVCSSPADVEEAYSIVADADVWPNRVWIMPAGTTVGEMAYRWDLAEEALRYGFNLSSRLHVLTWGDERGR